MAPLHKFSLSVTLISSLLLIISFQSINAEDGDLITRICAGKLSYKRECINYFRSNKQVVAAAATNKSLDLALAIIKNLVIPQAKTTHNVLLKKKQASPGVYGVCEAEWAKAIPTFERILEVTTKNKGYKNGVKVDLIKEANTLSKCGFDLMGKKIVDREIMEGEGNVHVALGAANRLLSAASVHKDNDLITRYCATMLGSKQECINYFRSNKQVVAAAAKNKSLDLALAILKDLVIPQVNTTHDVLLKKKQATPKAYDFCEAEYAKMIPSLESILEVTTKNKGNKDEHRFDLIRKAIAKCSFDLNDKKVLDREFTEAEGNALIALGAANDLLSAESVHEDNDLITRYCATMLGSKQECINYFRSNEQVVAAAAKNKSLDLALAILKDLVIPQVKSTHDVLLKKKQATPKTYDFCEAEYAKVIPSLESILEVTTKNKGNNDEHRFDLIKKAIVKCSFDLNGKKIVDAKLTEAEGNALVALSAADNLLSGIYG